MLSVREHDYVTAAQVIGCSSNRILLRHILPNVLAPVIVLATLGIPNAIIAGASLSFLGLGIQPPTADWGEMLSSGRNHFAIAWWLSIFPGLAIVDHGPDDQPVRRRPARRARPAASAMSPARRALVPPPVWTSTRAIPRTAGMTSGGQAARGRQPSRPEVSRRVCDGKVAIVTGAAGGIMRVILTRFAEAGAR